MSFSCFCKNRTSRRTYDPFGPKISVLGDSHPWNRGTQKPMQMTASSRTTSSGHTKHASPNKRQWCKPWSTRVSHAWFEWKTIEYDKRLYSLQWVVMYGLQHQRSFQRSRNLFKKTKSKEKGFEYGCILHKHKTYVLMLFERNTSLFKQVSKPRTQIRLAIIQTPRNANIPPQATPDAHYARAGN